MPACSYVVDHFDACFDVFALLLAVFSSSRATFDNFIRYSHVTLEIETYLNLGIVIIC